MQFESKLSLLSPDKLAYTSGIERLSGGILHVAVLTRMPGVSPKMIEWWLGSRSWVRRALCGDSLGRSLLVHCHEEMTTLAGFLPALYALETGAS